MDTKGVMEQIRELLAQGRSSSEVIAMGYKPPTVFKVQRQMRRPERTRQPGNHGYALQGSYSGEQRNGSLESLWPQFVAIRDAVLREATERGGCLPMCPACGEDKWEYYEVQDPDKPYTVQGCRCSRCHWAADFGELEPRVRHHVRFASKLQLTNALPHDDLRICVCCHHPFNKCTCLHPPTEG